MHIHLIRFVYLSVFLLPPMCIDAFLLFYSNGTRLIFHCPRYLFSVLILITPFYCCVCICVCVCVRALRSLRSMCWRDCVCVHLYACARACVELRSCVRVRCVKINSRRDTGNLDIVWSMSNSLTCDCLAIWNARWTLVTRVGWGQLSAEHRLATHESSFDRMLIHVVKSSPRCCASRERSFRIYFVWHM